MKSIKDNGGYTIIQDPAECLITTMPQSAKNLTTIDQELGIDQIIHFLNELNNQYQH